MTTVAEVDVKLGITGVSDVVGGLQEAQAAVRQTGTAADGMGIRAGLAGYALERLGGNIVGAFTGAAGQAMTFQTSMQNIASITDLSDAQIRQLGQSVEALGVATGQGPDNLAKGLYDVISAGYSTTDAMTILDAASRAASAGLTDEATSGRVLVSALQAYGQSANQAQHDSDIMFQAVKDGVFTFGELSQQMGDNLPLAHQMGVSMEQLGAAYVVMTRQGESLSESTTQVNAIMNSFMKPSTDMAGIIQQLGYDSGQTMLAQLGLGGATKAVADAAASADIPLSKLFPNIRAIRGEAALSKNDFKDYNDELKVMGHASDGAGATQEALSKQMEATGFHVAQLKSALSDLAISIGSAFLPAISGGADALRGLVDWFLKLPPVFGEIVAWAGLAAGAFVSLTGAMLLWDVGGGAVLAGIGEAVGLLGTLLPPVLLAAAAVGLLYEAWTHDWLGIRETAAAVIGGLGQLWDVFALGFGMFNDLRDSLGVVDAAFFAFGVTLGNLGTVFDGFAARVADVPVIGRPLQALFSALADGSRALSRDLGTLQTAVDAGMSAFRVLHDGGLNPVHAALLALNIAVGDSAPLFHQLADQVAQIPIVGGPLSALFDGMGTAATALSKTVVTLSDDYDRLRAAGLDPIRAAIGALNVVFPSFIDSWAHLGNVLRDGVTIWQDLRAAVSDFLAGNFSAGLSSLADAASTAFDALVNVGQGAFSAITTALGSIDWAGVTSRFHDLLRNALQAGADVGDWVLHVLAPTLGGWIDSAADWIGKTFPLFWQHVVIPFGDWLIDTLAPTVEGWVDDAAGWLQTNLPLFFRHVVVPFGDWVIDTLAPTVEGWVRDATGWLQANLPLFFRHVVVPFGDWAIDTLAPTVEGWVDGASDWLAANLPLFFRHVVVPFGDWVIDTLAPTVEGWVDSATGWLSTNLPLFFHHVVVPWGDWVLDTGAPTVIGWVDTGISWLVTNIPLFLTNVVVPFSGWVLHLLAPRIEAAADVLIDPIQSWVDSQAQGIDPHLQQVQVSIDSFVAKNFGGLGDFVNDVGKKISAANVQVSDWGVDIHNWVAGNLGNIAQFVNDLGHYINAANVQVSAWGVDIHNWVMANGGNVAAFVNDLGYYISAANVQVGQWGVDIHNWVMANAGDIAAFVNDAGKYISAVNVTVDQWAVDIHNWVAGLLPSAQSLADQIPGKIGAVAAKLTSWTIDLAGDINGKLTSIPGAGTVEAQIVKGIGTVVADLKAWSIDLGTFSASKILNIPGAATVIQYIKDGIGVITVPIDWILQLNQPNNYKGDQTASGQKLAPNSETAGAAGIPSAGGSQFPTSGVSSGASLGTQPPTPRQNVPYPGQQPSPIGPQFGATTQGGAVVTRLPDTGTGSSQFPPGMDPGAMAAAGHAAGQAFATALGAGLQTALTATSSVMNAINTLASGLTGRLQADGTAAGRGWATGLGSGLQTALTAVSAVTNAINTLATSLTGRLQADGTASGRGWATGLGSGLQTGLTAVSAVMNAVNTLASSLSARLTADGTNSGRGWATGLGAGLQTGLTAVTAVMNAVNTIAAALVARLTADGTNAGRGFATGLGTGLQLALTATTAVSAAITAILSTLAVSIAQRGLQGGQQFAVNLGAGLQLALSATVAVAAAITNSANTLASALGSAGQRGGSAFHQGIASGAQQAQGAFSSSASAISSAANALAGALAADGARAGQGFFNGINAGFNDAVRAASAMPGSIRGAIGSIDLYGIGYAAGESLASGLNASSSDVYAAAANLAAAASVGTTQPLSMHSPSKVFIQFGQWVAQGFAMGITSGTADVERAALGMSAALTAMRLPGFDGAAAPGLPGSAYRAAAAGPQTVQYITVTMHNTFSHEQAKDLIESMEFLNALPKAQGIVRLARVS